ncbi:O-antigen ligase family protein [Microbacterium aerolatum]|uniref:O-antigen ligase family protein n=1 Tax=Microbacterium aerolatum TaxID=153731 RepID=UPI00384DEE5D
MSLLLTLSIPTLAVLGGLATGVGPLFLFRLAVPFLLLLTLVTRRKGVENRSELRRWIMLAVAIWVLSSLMLLIFKSTDMFMAGRELASVFTGLALIVTMMLGPLDSETIRVWTRGWLIAYLVTVAVCVWELVSGRHASNYYYYVLDLPSRAYTGAIAGTLGNPNSLAFFLMASIFILFLGYSYELSPKGRWAYLIAMLPIPLLMEATDSRLMLGVLAATIVLYTVMWKPPLLFVVVPGFLIGVIVAMMNHAALFGAIGLDIATDASIAVRVNLILNGFAFAVETHMLGLGPGGFESRMERGAPYPAAATHNPHSGFIEILAQYGAVVAIVSAVVLIAAAVIGFRRWKSKSEPESMRVAGTSVALAVLSLPVLSLASSSTLDLSFPWVFVGIILLAAAVMERDDGRINARISFGYAGSRAGAR